MQPHTWFITGASRGLGKEIALAALEAGHQVVATGRKSEDVEKALDGKRATLLALKLDVTQPAQVRSAVAEALTRFGQIDVLVNNAGYGHLGFFEETTPADENAQFATNVFGLFDVTRAVLPGMRARRTGHIFNMSSLAGLRGAEFCSLYCASKFAIEGFSESLASEIAQFGITVTLVEPGPFRTDFLAPSSLRIGAAHLADYAKVRDPVQASFSARDGKQPGDPRKLASMLMLLAQNTAPPLRFLGGSDAVKMMDAKLLAMQTEMDTWRSSSCATDV